MLEIVGTDSQRKSSQLDWARQRVGSYPHQKPDIVRRSGGLLRDHGCDTFVVGRVAQEDAPGGTWGKLMWCGGSRVRVTRTIKDV
jgi:hypothetical protein